MRRQAPFLLHLPALLLGLTAVSCGDGPAPTEPPAQAAPAAPPPSAEPAGIGATARYGLDPCPAVELVEDHSDALLFWLRQGCRARRVFHVDTHDDCRPVPDENVAEIRRLADAGAWDELLSRSGVEYQSGPKLFNIGNFLFAGWKLGVVREVVWVLPGNRANLERIERVRGWLQAIGFDPASAATFHHDENGHVVGQRQGMPLMLCTADFLPRDDEPSLLSLDIDYLLGLYRDPAATPLRDLVLQLHGQIRDVGLTTDLAVISYSVHGGSIGLEHKTAGDRFALLAREPAAAGQPPALWQVRADALAARARHDLPAARRGIEQALAAESGSASLAYDLARIELESGELDATVAAIRRAISADPSYYLGFVELAHAVLHDPAFAMFDRQAIADRLLAEAGRVFPAPAGAPDLAASGADLLRQGDFRRAQIEHFKLVRKSVPPGALRGFRP